MELSILAQLTVSNELLLPQTLSRLFLLNENLHSFLLRMYFSTCLIFLILNKCCLHLNLCYQQQFFKA